MREGRARKGYRNKISVAAQCADALSSLKALYKVTLKRPSCHLLVHGRWMTYCWASVASAGALIVDLFLGTPGKATISVTLLGSFLTVKHRLESLLLATSVWLDHQGPWFYSIEISFSIFVRLQSNSNFMVDISPQKPHKLKALRKIKLWVLSNSPWTIPGKCHAPSWLMHTWLEAVSSCSQHLREPNSDALSSYDWVGLGDAT